jgi:hypothetical protein
MNGIVPKERIRSGAHVSLSFQLDLNIQTEKQKQQLLKKDIVVAKGFFSKENVASKRTLNVYDN